MSKRQGERYEALLRSVVEIPFKPAALLVCRGDEARARGRKLIAGLFIRQRQRDQSSELVETNLCAWRKDMGRSKTCRDDAPQPSGDDDGRADDRVNMSPPQIFGKVRVLNLVAFESTGSPSAEDALGDGSGHGRKTLANRSGRDAGLTPAADDHRCAGVFKAQEGRRVRLEASPRLFAHEIEDPLRPAVTGD